MSSKKCVRCKQVKPISSFSINDTGLNYGELGRNCDSCKARIRQLQTNQRLFVPCEIDEDYDGSDYIERLEKEHSNYKDLSYYPNTWQSIN